MIVYRCDNCKVECLSKNGAVILTARSLRVESEEFKNLGCNGAVFPKEPKHFCGWPCLFEWLPEGTRQTNLHEFPTK